MILHTCSNISYSNEIFIQRRIRFKKMHFAHTHDLRKHLFSSIVLLNVAYTLFRLKATGLREPFGDSPYTTLFHEIYTF